MIEDISDRDSKQMLYNLQKERHAREYNVVMRERRSLTETLLPRLLNVIFVFTVLKICVKYNRT